VLVCWLLNNSQLPFVSQAKMFKGKYHLIGAIGEGTYGRVYKATRGPAGEPEDEFYYAVKMIKKSPKEAERPMVTSISTMREVKLLRELKHPNVVNLTDVLGKYYIMNQPPADLGWDITGSCTESERGQLFTESRSGGRNVPVHSILWN
jgi:serine/threonine protein kinase